MNQNRKDKLLKIISRMNSVNAISLIVNDDLIQCFNVAMTDDELDFLLKLNDISYSYEDLQNLSNLCKKDFEKLISDIFKKGFIHSNGLDEDKERFNLSSILTGWFELYLSDPVETEEQVLFSKTLNNYLSKIKIPNVQYEHVKNSKPSGEIHKIQCDKKRRTIEVNKNIPPGEFAIMPSHRVVELIDKYGVEGRMAVHSCFCRKWKRLAGQNCVFGQEDQSCIFIGNFIKKHVEAGIAEFIDKKEALLIIKRAAKKGAVQQVFYRFLGKEEGEMAICSCCWDCCDVLSMYNRGQRHLYVKSYFISNFSDSDNACIKCGKCEKHCPTNAIRLIDGIIKLNKEKCIGCGQCRIQCPKDLFYLCDKERDVFLPKLKKARS